MQFHLIRKIYYFIVFMYIQIIIFEEISLTYCKK